MSSTDSPACAYRRVFVAVLRISLYVLNIYLSGWAVPSKTTIFKHWAPRTLQQDENQVLRRSAAPNRIPNGSLLTSYVWRICTLRSGVCAVQEQVQLAITKSRLERQVAANTRQMQAAEALAEPNDKVRGRHAQLQHHRGLGTCGERFWPLYLGTSRT